MWIAFVLIIFLSVFAFQPGAVNEASGISASDESRLALIQKYRIFKSATERHVRARPEQAGAIDWQALRTAPTSASGWESLSLPGDWLAITDGAGGFVICAKLNERIAVELGIAARDEKCP